MREELRDRTAKRLCWRCDEPWSRDHRYRKGRLLMVEPIEEFEPEDVDRESVEDTEEDLQLTVGALVTILIDTGSTNNFVDSKIAAWLTLQIEDCSSKGKQVILRGKRGSEATTISTQRMEKVLCKVHNSFLIQIQGLQIMEPKEIEDTNLPALLVEFSDVFAKSKGLSPS
ncbi:hypothetical protein BHE74_00025003 [Ensete ventricosum]|nr:hypothetical protein BHE74_00025003 [Ensete ventricosum]RZS03424.1 hypothetical protein BHM03_00033605 [Ensete ventricosum]